MTVYLYTPEQHAQIVDALDCGDYDVQQVAREMLKAMQPVESCGWMGEDGDIEDELKPWMSSAWNPLYTPTKAV